MSGTLGRLFRLVLVTLCMGFLAPLASSQKAWGDSEDRMVKRFHEIADQVHEALLLADFETAERRHGDLSWYVRQLETRGHGEDARAVQMRSRMTALHVRVENKQVLPAEAERKVHYVSRERGKSKRGGHSAEVPAKFLWRALEGVSPGDEVRISGPVYGWRKSGKLEFEVPHVTLRGGYSPDFSEWDPTRFPSVFMRPENSKSTDLSQQMIHIKVGTGVVIEGLRFDQRYLNIYTTDGNLDAARSRVSPMMHVLFQGEFTIRNCTFQNGSFGGLVLSGRENGKAIVSDNQFLNIVGAAIDVGGEAEYHIEHNTFALLHSRRSVDGAAIHVGSTGSVFAINNIFAYADTGVRSVRGNMRITMNGNQVHGLSRGILVYSSRGRSTVVPTDELEESEVEEAEDNVDEDPELLLHGLTLARYLKSTHRSGLSKEFLEAEVPRALARIQPGDLGEESAKAETKKPKEEKVDPFGSGSDPFATRPAETPLESGVGDGTPVPKAGYYATPYPWQAPWLAPGTGRAGHRKPHVITPPQPR